MEHKCEREAEIAEMKATIKRLIAIIDGDDKPGLKETVTVLSVTVSQLSENTKDLATALKGILQFQNETVGKIKAEQSYKVSMRWVIGLMVTIIIAFATLYIEK